MVISRVKTALQKENVGKAFSVLSIFLVSILFISIIRSSIFSEVPEDRLVWIELTFLLLAATIAQYIVIETSQPSVIVLLVLGLAISPKTVELAWPAVAQGVNWLFEAVLGAAILSPDKAPHFVNYSGTIHLFAQIGAIILMFKVGLHSDEREIFNARNVLIGALGVLVPLVGGLCYSYLTEGGLSQGVFFGVALAATSVGVTAAVLDQYGLIRRGYSRIILGAAVVDDILALLLFSLATTFFGGGKITAQFVLYKVALAAVFVVGGILVGKALLKKLFTTTQGGRRTFLITMSYLFFYSYAAEFIGLSAIVGAFVAGVTVNYHSHVDGIIRKMQPLELFFTPIFFISLGMLIDPTTIFSAISPILILTAIAFATKYVGCGAGALLSGSSPAEARNVGIGMVPRGEIAMIIALVGLTTISADGTKIFSPAEYTIISGMTLLTTIGTPFLIKGLICKGEKE